MLLLASGVTSGKVVVGYWKYISYISCQQVLIILPLCDQRECQTVLVIYVTEWSLFPVCLQKLPLMFVRKNQYFKLCMMPVIVSAKNKATEATDFLKIIIPMCV